MKPADKFNDQMISRPQAKVPIPHIVIYSDDSDMGGVAQIDHSLALELRKMEFRVSVVKPLSQSPLRAEKINSGIHCVELGYDASLDFKRTIEDEAAPSELFDRLQPSLIVFSDNCPVSNMAAKRAAIRRNIPFVIVVGLAAPYLARNFAFALPELAQTFRRSKAVVTPSAENLQVLRSNFGLPLDRGEVIYGGRADKFFDVRDAHARNALRAELAVSDNHVLCLTAARMEPIKGYELQLGAMMRLRHMPAWQRVRFVWIGDGTQRPDLEAKARQLGVSDHIHFAGYRWDTPRWFDSADMFLLPSFFEGMPLAISEAMAKRLPVIATGVSGIPEQLGETGHLLPNPSIDANHTVERMADVIAYWTGDEALRQSIGAACHQRADQLFRERTMLRKYLALVERALASGAGNVHVNAANHNE